MRIHTSLDYLQMRDVLHASGAPIGFEHIDSHGSRTHARAFEVRLTGSGGRNNTGLYGAGDYDGATWDEWGAFFGALYDADPTARCGGTAKRPVYIDADHYHYVTGDRFRVRVHSHDDETGMTRLTYLPADTHPRHGWVYQGEWGDHGSKGWKCRKCSAERPGHVQDEAYRRDVAA